MLFYTIALIFFYFSRCVAGRRGSARNCSKWWRSPESSSSVRQWKVFG
jgi:hypothetical protein